MLRWANWPTWTVFGRLILCGIRQNLEKDKCFLRKVYKQRTKIKQVKLSGIYISAEKHGTLFNQTHYIERLKLFHWNASFPEILSERSGLSWITLSRCNKCSAVVPFFQVTQKDLSSKASREIQKNFVQSYEDKSHFSCLSTDIMRLIYLASFCKFFFCNWGRPIFAAWVYTTRSWNCQCPCSSI